ncbi:MAG: LUD domain-containing protein [Bacillota bacterium]
MVVEIVKEVLAQRGGHCIISDHPLFAAWDLHGALERADVPVGRYRSEADRPSLALATVSVTVASAAALILPGTLVPGVAGWMIARAQRYRSGEELPSSIVLATGPSRSADIAGDLALGVHGPGEVYAVLARSV